MVNTAKKLENNVLVNFLYFINFLAIVKHLRDYKNYPNNRFVKKRRSLVLKLVLFIILNTSLVNL